MANLVYCDDNSCLKNNYYFALSTTSACNPTQLPPSHTGIADSGASGFYFAPGAPVANLDHQAPTVGVRVANGLPARSVASATLASAPSLPPSAMTGHVMPSFPHTLIGLGPFADLGCTIVFTKTAVSVIHQDGHSILEGWRELDGPRLWRFPLAPTKPSVSEPASFETYEEPGPGGSAADFFTPPPSTPIERPTEPSMPPPGPPLAAPLLHPSQSILAIDTAGQACSVTYMYGVAQALAVASSSSKTPFDPRSLDLPSIPALVRFYHACLGFPVKQSWLEAIKAGNCDTFDGLTYSNAARYCPDSDETIMGHLAQQRQNIRSTKPKTPFASPPPSAAPQAPSNELFIRVLPISKLYTDDTGRFPVKARSGNQYVMIAHHADGNLILQQAFKTRSDKHRIEAYNAIMTRLAARGLVVDLQILDNEASAAYKHAITVTWKCKFQLVPPDMHRRNRAERAIRTFKDHFLAILAGVDATFPPYLWDLLLPQAELTLNLLRQSVLNPRISAWEYFQGPFDFNKTPLGPVGCRVLIHAKPATRRSWDFRAKEGFYIGPALDSYRCFKLVKSDTKSQVISDTVEFRHAFRAIPSPSPEDKIIHGLQTIASSLKDAPLPTTITQHDAIANLRDLFESWRLLSPPPNIRARIPSPARPRVPDEALPRVATPSLSPSSAWTPTPPASAFRSPVPSPLPFPVAPRRISFADSPLPPAVAPSPRVIIAPTIPPREPIAHRTRSRAPAPSLALFAGARPYHELVTYNIPTAKSTRALPVPLGFAGLCEAYSLAPKEVDRFANLCASLETLDCCDPSALSVLDPATGEFLEHRQLRRDPRYKAVWDTSYANELGRLCQGIGSGTTPTKQRVGGTNTFFLVDFQDIPLHKRKEICHTMVVCEVRPEKDDPDRTRITIGGNRICYPGDVGTNTASLELVKLLLNSVLSRKGARFSTIDLKNFYLDTPMPDPEYVRIKLSDIPDEFIKEYALTGRDRDGWIYFEIRQGCYGLPQAGILANDLLRSRLVAEGFYEAASTPGLWRHKWRPLQFCLIVDDFGVEYVGIEHFDYLLNLLKKFHGVQFNMAGDKLAGISIQWDYPRKRCRLSMPGYIDNLLLKFKHPRPTKPRLSPYACIPISYGAKTQLTPEVDTSALLDDKRKHRIQEIVGSLLYYARAVDNKLLVALSAIAARQSQATVAIELAVALLLDYVATYPNDGIVYRASDMILCAHADAGFLNESQSRSRAGAHIYLSENDAFPRFNGAVLSIAQIIKFVMASAAESELAALFITAREMIPHRQTLIDMGWPQPKSPIQTDNSTASGVVNNTIVPRRSKMMDMRFWWLRCRASQDQFRYYWDAGSKNWADYHTKHHPDTYHESHRTTHAGIWDWIGT